ncbi:MAG: hypothetical protein U0271_10210 [Polyangiaceae bacterium]
MSVFKNVAVALSLLGLFACGNANNGASSASAKKDASASSTTKASAPAPAASSPAAVKPTASAPPVEAPKDEGVALTKHFAAVGDKETRTNEKMNNMTILEKKDGKDVEHKVAETKTLKVVEECVGVDDNACTKFKVTVEQHEQRLVQDGKEETKTLPTQGKTFMIVPKDGTPDITLEDGSPASKDEIELLKNDYDVAGKDKKVISSLPDKVKVGDSLDDLGKVLAETNVKEDEKNVKQTVTIKVKSIGEVDGKKVATLEVHISKEGDAPMGHAKGEVTGTIDLRLDGGVPVKMDMQGTVDLAFEGDKGSVAGIFTEKASSTFSW